MTTTTISPVLMGEATQVELSDSTTGTKKSVWRKEILPSGTRQYKGQTLDFSKINPECERAFNEGVLDQLPFVFALADNSHSDLPERYKGEVARVAVEEDGKLFGYFDFSQHPDTEEYVSKNKKFGVSSRIEVNYERPDTGKTYEYALSHVCGTLRPHIRGLSPWEKIELSEEVKRDQSEVLDLSTEVLDGETDNKKGDDLVPVEITKEELADLRRFMKEVKDAEESLASDKASGEESGSGGTANLSESDSIALTEARNQANQAMELARRSQIELAETRWNSRKRELVLAGVPPHILDLAEPVLKLPQRGTIELSDSAKVDVSETLEKVLDACKGMINLSEESGHGVGDTGSGPSQKEFEDFMADWGYVNPVESK